MKTVCLTTALASISLWLHAQGTFVYDQQSSIESWPAESFGFLQSQGPIGQSFTPSLTAVGFVRFDLFDWNNNNGTGATVYVNVRANAIDGAIIGSSTLVSMADGFGVGGGGFTNFLFASPVAVTPGTVYYFDLVVQPGGDVWAIRRFVQGSDYAGGTEYFQGQTGPDDLWFREGIVVPEPGSAALFLLGAGVLFCARRKLAR